MANPGQTYCPFCGVPAGRDHQPGCPRDTTITALPHTHLDTKE